jgi:hypothetical protein
MVYDFWGVKYNSFFFGGASVLFLSNSRLSPLFVIGALSDPYFTYWCV